MLLWHGNDCLPPVWCTSVFRAGRKQTGGARKKSLRKSHQKCPRPGIPLLVFLLKSKCFRRCFFWPHISNMTTFYPLKYWQDFQLFREAQRTSTAMWSLKRQKNSKKAVDIVRCQCEQQINVTSALAEYAISLWIRAGERLLPSFCIQICSKPLLDIPTMKCLFESFVCFPFSYCLFLVRNVPCLINQN